MPPPLPLAVLLEKVQRVNDGDEELALYIPPPS